MELQAFRRQVLDALHTAKSQWPDASIHLLYSPELSDPLEVSQDTKRECALIRPPSGWPMEQANMPRVVTLDCRRVASYLLETDPALDDPLFESSVTQAHAEAFGQPAPDLTATNEVHDAVLTSVCGWVVSPDPAATVALRFSMAGKWRDERRFKRWLRWHDPRLMPHLWPALGDDQRRVLLGEQLLWLAPGLWGELRGYIGEPGENGPTAPEALLDAPYVPLPTPSQWQRLQRVPLVNNLLAKWRDVLAAKGQDLPATSLDRLHAYLGEAQERGLDGEDMSFYAMVAVQLAPSATQDAEFDRMVQQCRAKAASLRDGIDGLSDEFWGRYGAGPGGSVAQAQPTHRY